MAESLGTYLLVSSALFAVGLVGVLLRRNLVAMLIGVELMLNAVILNLVAFARFAGADPGTGQIFALFIIAVAAAEVGVGLAMVLLLYRNRRSIDLTEIDQLRG